MNDEPQWLKTLRWDWQETDWKSANPYWILLICAGLVAFAGYVIMSATLIGTVAVAIMVALGWLWSRLDTCLQRRQDRKRAERERDEEAGPLIRVEDSSLARTDI